jgi:hypothetical protein
MIRQFPPSGHFPWPKELGTLMDFVLLRKPQNDDLLPEDQRA